MAVETLVAILAAAGGVGLFFLLGFAEDIHAAVLRFIAKHRSLD